MAYHTILEGVVDLYVGGCDWPKGWSVWKVCMGLKRECIDVGYICWNLIYQFTVVYLVLYDPLQKLNFLHCIAVCECFHVSSWKVHPDKKWQICWFQSLFHFFCFSLSFFFVFSMHFNFKDQINFCACITAIVLCTTWLHKHSTG